MFEELNQDFEPKKNRHVPSPRTRSPRAARTARQLRKATGFQGAHRRRNKHWSW
jgi:hypothetical protein